MSMYIENWMTAPLSDMQKAARMDSVLDTMVASDLRCVLMRYAEAIHALKAARMLADNVAEFGGGFDGEIYDMADSQIQSAIQKAGSTE